MLNNLLIILAFVPALFILYAIHKGWTDRITEILNLFYRRLRFKYSKQDLKAILKYDPLNLLN